MSVTRAALPCFCSQLRVHFVLDRLCVFILYSLLKRHVSEALNIIINGALIVIDKFALFGQFTEVARHDVTKFGQRFASFCQCAVVVAYDGGEQFHAPLLLCDLAVCRALGLAYFLQGAAALLFGGG